MNTSVAAHSRRSRQRGRRLCCKLRQQGFTILELIIVIALMIVLIGLAALSFASLENDDELTGPSDKLIRMAKIANRAAIVQGRPIIIAFDKEQFGFADGEGGEQGHCTLPEGMKVKYQRWNGGRNYLSADGLVWKFFPTGLCDALRFQFTGPQGIVELGFNPLTGSVTDQVSYVGKR
jgi:type II secretion system protein H